MNRKLLALYGLKWNPFAPELPGEALLATPRIESFCWRIENGLAREGGFAVVQGDPGTGKSVALRILAERLGKLRDVKVGPLAHPQSGINDFYRELGDLFTVEFKPHNRWGGFKALREKWHEHIAKTLVRPLLLVDEAQEANAAVLCELRTLTSSEFDSKNLLSVVLAGDKRLGEMLRRDDLLPLASRIRTRLALEAAPRDELLACLKHLVTTAGNSKLLTPDLAQALVDHAAGNYRALVTFAGELLAAAAEREAPQLDEKLFFEIFQLPPAEKAAAPSPARRRR